MIWFCVASVMYITSVISAQEIDTSRIRVFPAGNRSIAGVFQVSFLDDLSQPRYAFNASDARRLCLSLGVNIASKEQVRGALARGLETCRFGWVDEHFAVIPRIKALSNCGQSQTGLVTWRAPVTKVFDVFCFNESDAASQLTDTTTNSPSSRGFYSEPTKSTRGTRSTSSPSARPSSSSAPKTTDVEAVPARYVTGAQGFSGAKVLVVTSTCGLLLVVIILLAYLKLQKTCTKSSDAEQQKEYLETDEWTCVKNVEQNKEVPQDDEKIEVEENAS